MSLHYSVGMSWGVVLFTTFGGLRGAVSLILAQILVLDQEKKVLSSRHITAEARSASTHSTRLCVMYKLPAAGGHLACLEGMPADPCCHISATDGAVDLWLRSADPHHQCALDALAAESYRVRGKELSSYAVRMPNALTFGRWLVGTTCNMIVDDCAAGWLRLVASRPACEQRRRVLSSATRTPPSTT